MKITFLLTVAALAPLTLFAQNPATSPGGGAAATEAAPAVATPPTLAPGRIAHVEYDGEELRALVESLQARAQEALETRARETGIYPVVDTLNVIISPGLETRRVPALSLRNVSPIEVLTVVTTVIGLGMEPVMADDVAGGNKEENRVVAWIIKDAGGQDPFASGSGSSGGGGDAPALDPLAKLLTNAPPSPASPQETTSAPEVVPGLTGGGGGLTVPVPVAIAGSPAPGGGLGMAAPAARVFGVGPLLTVTDPDSDTGKKQRVEKYVRLQNTLNELAQDQGLKADIRAYNDMDIIVVKSADPAAIALIAEAIQAMKSNVDPAPTATGPRVH